jgi:hypothetical protein
MKHHSILEQGGIFDRVAEDLSDQTLLGLWRNMASR